MRPTHVKARLRALELLADEDERVRTLWSRIPLADTIRLRRQLVRLPEPLADPVGGPPVSDQHPPDRRLGPPVRRLVRSRGILLQLAVALLAVAQREKLREPWVLPPLVHPLNAPLRILDLVARPATLTDGRQLSVPDDKRLRSLHRALDELADEQLVAFTAEGGSRFNHPIHLLHDADDHDTGRLQHRRYARPKRTTKTVRLPKAFFTNGWHYCLQDSELLAYLMVRDVCTHGPGYVYAGERLRRYAVPKDALLRTRLLEDAGLLEVATDANQDDHGMVLDWHKGYRPLLQQWTLTDEGLDRPAHDALREALERRLR